MDLTTSSRLQGRRPPVHNKPVKGPGVGRKHLPLSVVTPACFASAYLVSAESRISRRFQTPDFGVLQEGGGIIRPRQGKEALIGRTMTAGGGEGRERRMRHERTLPEGTALFDIRSPYTAKSSYVSAKVGCFQELLFCVVVRTRRFRVSRHLRRFLPTSHPTPPLSGVTTKSPSLFPELPPNPGGGGSWLNILPRRLALE